MNNKIG